MPICDVLAELKAERNRLNKAIGKLEKLAQFPGRDIALVNTPESGRATYMRSLAQRRAHAERMRAYWANRKKGA